VLVLCFVSFAAGIGSAGITLWLPQILQSMGHPNASIGPLLAGFGLIGMAAMFAWGRSSDKRGERVWHVSLPLFVAATGLIAASLSLTGAISLVALACILIGLLAIDGPFFALPSTFLGGAAVAGGIALINSTGSLGAFVGPVLIGVLKEQSGGYATGMIALAIALVFAATAVLLLGRAMTARPLLQGEH
jgi:ACS family tartrate transporter-like MFS transporter